MAFLFAVTCVGAYFNLYTIAVIACIVMVIHLGIFLEDKTNEDMGIIPIALMITLPVIMTCIATTTLPILEENHTNYLFFEDKICKKIELAKEKHFDCLELYNIYTQTYDLEDGAGAFYDFITNGTLTYDRNDMDTYCREKAPNDTKLPCLMRGSYHRYISGKYDDKIMPIFFRRTYQRYMDSYNQLFLESLKQSMFSDYTIDRDFSEDKIKERYDEHTQRIETAIKNLNK